MKPTRIQTVGYVNETLTIFTRLERVLITNIMGSGLALQFFNATFIIALKYYQNNEY